MVHLGRFDGISFKETARVYARLDRLLRHQRILQTHSTARPMDTPPRADVLLEDVEATQETVQRDAQAGGSPQANQNGRQQPQGLLETIAHAGDQHGHGKRVARRARVNQPQGTMEQNTLSGVIVGRCFSNRRMRTRMSGGVGAGG